MLVEYGFLDSKKDDVNQLKNNWQSLAEAVVRAIIDEKGLSYVPQAGDNSYVVQRGDTLYSIAQRFNVPVNELRRINNLSSNILNIGQVLMLPSNSVETPDITTDEYIVQSGDTLYKIAIRFGTSVNDLKQLNNITGNTISIGQILKIPVQENTPIDIDYYTVVSGDTLYSIAEKFNTTVAELIALNNLNSDILSIGQLLKISGSENTSSENKYTVLNGDTLYSISNKYGTSVNELKKLNNLTSDILSVGQVLSIPKTSPSVNYYSVQSGDTLFSIAKKFGTTVNKLKSVNNLSGNLISLNQELIIPTD